MARVTLQREAKNLLFTDVSFRLVSSSPIECVYHLFMCNRSTIWVLVESTAVGSVFDRDNDTIGVGERGTLPFHVAFSNDCTCLETQYLKVDHSNHRSHTLTKLFVWTQKSLSPLLTSLYLCLCHYYPITLGIDACILCLCLCQGRWIQPVKRKKICILGNV